MTYVYMIKNKNNDLYIGVSENPNERIIYHNTKMGAKFTKNKLDFEIVFLEKYNNLADARQREIQLKKWRRDKKEALIDSYKTGLNTKR